MNDRPVVAAFDFDGTLTTGDSLFPFLAEAVGPFKTFFSLVKQVPGMIGYLLGKVSRQQLKEAILKAAIGGKPIEEIQQKGQAFARNSLKKMLKPEGMEKLYWHQQQGHRCVLISANLNVYLDPWGKLEKFDDVLCSNLQVDDKGLITGYLAGKNCRGAEKARRLLDLLGERPTFLLYVYGDSDGDNEILEMADYPFYRKF